MYIFHIALILYDTFKYVCFILFLFFLCIEFMHVCMYGIIGRFFYFILSISIFMYYIYLYILFLYKFSLVDLVIY